MLKYEKGEWTALFCQAGMGKMQQRSEADNVELLRNLCCQQEEIEETVKSTFSNGKKWSIINYESPEGASKTK